MADNVLVFIFSSLFCGILGEAALRVIEDFRITNSAAARESNLARLQRLSRMPGLFWEPSPSYRSNLSQISFHGFRDREFNFKKKSGRVRIAHIGDSITFGEGL